MKLIIKVVKYIYTQGVKDIERDSWFMLKETGRNDVLKKSIIRNLMVVVLLKRVKVFFKH